MRPKTRTPRVTTSITISPEFHSLCVEHDIGFSEAARVGISFLLAEKGVREYDNSLNLYRKFLATRQLLEDTSQKLTALEEKHGLSK